MNRNINFTNICYTGCRFCAFAQRKGDADAYTLSYDEVGDRALEAYRDGATEVCMQGGIDPELPATGYADLVRAVKKRVPSMHVHAFSPMEIVNGAAKSGVSIRDWLIGLREAGPGHHPRHRRRDPRRRGPLGAHQGQAADVGVDRGGHHRARGRAAVQLDDDVRPRRSAEALDRPSPDPARHPGPHRRLHRVRAAAVRAPELAAVSGRRGASRARRTATTARCTRWRESCCTAGSLTSRPAGSSSASSAPR